MRVVRKLAGLFLLVGIVACGPTARPGGGGDDGNGPDAGKQAPDAQAPGPCVPAAESTVQACSDGMDNDCDGLYDCADPDCSGIGACPVCGMVQHPLGTPLPLPDGAGAGPAYTSKLHFDGFAMGQTFAAISNIQSVCLKIEHSWLRDLQIELHAPTGQVVVLQQMLGQTGSEIYLGQANDADSSETPVPGVGADYCWKPTAANPAMLAYANSGSPMLSFNGHDELPPGDYSAAGAWTPLVGAMLNGDWMIYVQDRWAIDNGFIFEWSIAFDPSLVQDCSGPVIQ